MCGSVLHEYRVVFMVNTRSSHIICTLGATFVVVAAAAVAVAVATITARRLVLLCCLREQGLGPQVRQLGNLMPSLSNKPSSARWLEGRTALKVALAQGALGPRALGPPRATRAP